MTLFTLLDLTGVFSIGKYVYLATLGLVVTLVAAISYHLTRLGYIVEKGVFKRKMVLTESGKTMLKKYL